MIILVSAVFLFFSLSRSRSARSDDGARGARGRRGDGHRSAREGASVREAVEGRLRCRDAMGRSREVMKKVLDELVEDGLFSFEEADNYIRDSPRVNELLERVQAKLFDEVRLNLLDLFNEVEDEDAIDRSKPK